MIEWIAAGVGCLVLAPYALLPLLIKSSVTMNAKPCFVEQTMEQLGPKTEQFVHPKVSRLESLGFTLLTVLGAPDAGSSVKSYVTLLYDDSIQVMALINIVIGITPGFEENLRTEYIEYVTRYTNGDGISTYNSSELGAFPETPGQKRVQVPQIKDENQLLKIHLAAAQEFGQGKTINNNMEDWGPYFSGEIIKQYDRVVDKGLFQLDSKAEVYRTTWKGAYLMTWAQLWPFKKMREASMQKKAQEFAHRYLGQG